LNAQIALIGGSGVGNRLRMLGGNTVHVSTRYGLVRGRFVPVRDFHIFVVSRHSEGHSTPPHAVNYRGITEALIDLGIQKCISTAAVGSLRPEWTPGTFVACSDFLDLSGRNLTMYSSSVVHTDFSSPFSSAIRKALVESSEESIITEGVYLGLNGPRYETPQEIKTFRNLGADVVGMTAATEAILMRERGIEYGCLAIVTNLASGISVHPLSHQEVVEEMDRSGERAVALLLRSVEHLLS
jgi:5'-methylthioadenosine phosphorylase